MKAYIHGVCANLTSEEGCKVWSAFLTTFFTECPSTDDLNLLVWSHLRLFLSTLLNSLRHAKPIELLTIRRSLSCLQCPYQEAVTVIFSQKNLWPLIHPLLERWNLRQASVGERAVPILDELVLDVSWLEAVDGDVEEA